MLAPPCGAVGLSPAPGGRHDSTRGRGLAGSGGRSSLSSPHQPGWPGIPPYCPLTWDERHLHSQDPNPTSLLTLNFGFRNLKQQQAELCWSLLPSPERKNGRCSLTKAHLFFSADSRLQLFYSVWWTWNWNIWFFYRKLQEACGLKNWKSCGRPLSWRWCQHGFTERSQEPAIAFEKWL